MTRRDAHRPRHHEGARGEADGERDGRVHRAQRLREARRAATLEAARGRFSQRGYHATSIDDIIEAAGIARGTFYLYFESKRAIFDAMLDELFLTLQGAVRRIEIGPGAPPPTEQVEATVDRVFATLDQNRDLARILLRSAVGIDADFDRKLNDFYGRIEFLMVRAVSAGIEMGLVRPCDPRIAARCILGATKEVVQFAFVDDSARAASPDPDLDPGRGPRGSGSSPSRGRFGHELVSFTLEGLFLPRLPPAR